MELRKYSSRIEARETEQVARGGLHKSPLSVAPHVAPAGDIIVIERRALLRECLARALRPTAGQSVRAFASVEDWLDAAKDASASVVILSVSNADAGELSCEIALLTQAPECPPLVIFSDADAPGEIVKALHNGARGFIPTSVSLDVAVQALRLVGAGGVFVPATSLIAASQLTKAEPARPNADDLFTGRQMAVAEALSRGKSNKLIAYELTMCESTVKVHVRNIMKKLKARNRTEVAVMVNAMIAAHAVQPTTARP
jgi:DNA-binding NarL/FixJ family response regulator